MFIFLKYCVLITLYWFFPPILLVYTYAYTNSRFTSENGREHCYSLLRESI